MEVAFEERGDGPPIVLLHGLTATRRYVVMGSSALPRAGYRVISYDARGHGASPPARDPAAYRYEDLVEDLAELLDRLEIPRAVLAGSSMGAHTALGLALGAPERVCGLVLITPAFDPEIDDSARLARWDALAEGLRRGGVEGFMAAYPLDSLQEPWRASVERAIRQRMGEHEHPLAVADALQAVPRAAPFERWAQLGAIEVPCTVVADRDEADPEHPLAVGERYAQTIPGARLVVEDAGPPPRSPIAWQGGQLSRVIAELAEQSAP
ncbi:MAG TPA: alpha/beta hydrolase [Solirubrobacteraceae bacterium]|jgi:pimeloyl-ACP methyl ester carboxylesterase|nr:alpha/beta hydrolase [Solirubrobacteraceae bacterium]